MTIWTENQDGQVSYQILDENGGIILDENSQNILAEQAIIIPGYSIWTQYLDPTNPENALLTESGEMLLTEDGEVLLMEQDEGISSENWTLKPSPSTTWSLT